MENTRKAKRAIPGYVRHRIGTLIFISVDLSLDTFLLVFVKGSHAILKGGCGGGVRSERERL